jgi:hypothetical protein
VTKFYPTTGGLYEHIKDAPDCQDMLEVYRHGLKFKKEQRGHQGETSKLVYACASRAVQPCSFQKLLEQLHAEALKRERDGERASIVERVSYADELVTLHTVKGERHITFATLRGHLTPARSLLKNKK